MDKVPMTKKGLDSLNAELTLLKTQERPAVIKAIAEARDHGDLSENAEYHSAREKQSFIEGRIKELESVISRAEVINTSGLSGDTVKFGAHVTIIDEDTEEEITYQIVGDHESNLKEKKISLSSPIARAMIGKKLGDTFEFSSPKGSKSYEILKVDFE